MDTSIFFRYADESPAEDDLEFLQGCDEADWARVLAAGRRERFRAGEILVAEGERGRVLSIVLDGRLVSVVGTGRRQRRLAAIPTGSVVGEVSFIDGGVRSASVIAETDGELLRIEFDDFEILARSRPQLAYRIMLDLSRILAMRLRRLTDVATSRPR